MKKFLSMTLTLIMLMALAVSALAVDTVPPTDSDPEENWIMPIDLLIDYGTIRNQIGLDKTIKLNKDNGKYVNLYNDNLQTTTIETNDGVIFEIKDGVEDSFVGGMRRDSYIAVDSSLNDKSGSQTIPFRTNSDYPYYRVFVSNTSKTSYNITLTDASGKNQLTSSPITLGAGRHTNITNSNAASGMRYLTVTAQDGSALDGTVRIRLASSADELANG